MHDVSWHKQVSKITRCFCEPSQPCRNPRHQFTIKLHTKLEAPGLSVSPIVGVNSQAPACPIVVVSADEQLGGSVTVHGSFDRTGKYVGGDEVRSQSPSIILNLIAVAVLGWVLPNKPASGCCTRTKVYFRCRHVSGLKCPQRVPTCWREKDCNRNVNSK